LLEALLKKGHEAGDLHLPSLSCPFEYGGSMGRLCDAGSTEDQQKRLSLSGTVASRMRRTSRAEGERLDKFESDRLEHLQELRQVRDLTTSTGHPEDPEATGWAQYAMDLRGRVPEILLILAAVETWRLVRNGWISRPPEVCVHVADH
jgi:hypothetical protein